MKAVAQDSSNVKFNHSADVAGSPESFRARLKKWPARGIFLAALCLNFGAVDQAGAADPQRSAADVGAAAVAGTAAARATADTEGGASNGNVAAAVREPKGFWTGPINSAVPRTIAGGKVIHVQELAALLASGNTAHAVVIDVSDVSRRPQNIAPGALWLPLPHHAIPGAIWIPGAGVGDPAEAVDLYYRNRLARLTRHNLARTVIVYCHERCWLSWNGAKRAIQYGYSNVYWFPDGIEGWRKAGFKTSVAEPEGSAGP